MSEPFGLLDIDDAREFLRLFDAVSRRKGESLFSNGSVTIESVTPGTLYVGILGDLNASIRVTLEYSEEMGWDASCTCRKSSYCEHAYAAMKTLLAEASLASVRDISAGALSLPSTPQKQEPKPDKKSEFSSKPLAELASEALERPLTLEEKKFCKRLHDLYSRCSVSRRMSNWDLNELGVRAGGLGWETLDIWPSFPETEHEFWLYIVEYLTEQQFGVPEFLHGVSNSPIIQERMATWRRRREIESWTRVLKVQPDFAADVVSRGEYDLRIVLGEDSALVECKRPGTEKFIQVGVKRMNELLENWEQGVVEMSTESDLLGSICASRIREGRSLDFDYRSYGDIADLGRILRAPLLVSKTVAPDGAPLIRVAEPARWEVIAPEDIMGSYRFKLVQADGSSMPKIFGAVPGNPTLYLTYGRVFRGPRLRSDVLPPGKETFIPAEALETLEGVRFLNALKIALPERLAEQVRTVPLIVTITCELGPISQFSPTEVCRFDVEAASSQGKNRERWTATGWVSQSNNANWQKAKSDGLVYYDRTVLDRIPALMEPLGVKSDMSAIYMRVTKNFAEIFSEWLKSLPGEIKVNLKGELASFAQADVSGRVKLSVVEKEIDWFDLSVIVDVTDTTLSPAEIKLLLHARGKYVRLGDKGWRRLQFDLSDDDDQRLANLGLNPRELSDEPQRLHALQLADAAARRFLPEHQAEQIQRRASEIKARVTPALPSGVKADLRPYQLDGYHFLAYLGENRFGGILADDMGLGKTLQTLAWILWLRGQKRSKSAGPALVVCPKSVMDNWHAEAGRFTPELRVKSWPASELASFTERLGDADVHVLNYNQLRILGESLVPVPWLAVILDEGQYIKNPNSQTTQVARALRSEHRLVLSGTPIENRLMDLWSLMSFSMPGVLGSRAQFTKLYDSKGDPLARRRLAARVRPFLLRRTKSQVAKDLPDRIEEDLFCEIEGEQKALYRAELKRAQQQLLRVQSQKQLNEERFSFLTSLLRLRQICCHPALVNPETKEMGTKMEALLDQLEPLMEEGHKVLVFSQFVELLGLLKPVIEEKGWAHFYLAGETENRGELVRSFQSAEGGAVFLISLKAGGFGLNLTAASYVVLFDPWWNPAVENQAIDRTHRIGQVNKVIAYRLLVKDSVEEKIRMLQKQKSALAQDVFGEENFSQALSLQDLQFLFAD